MIEPAAIERAAPARSGAPVWRRRATPYLLVAPALAVLAFILAYPLVYNIYLSFWRWRLTDVGSARFVGLEAYRYLLFEDPDFWASARFTMTFLVLTLAAELALGLGSALLVHRLTRGRHIVTALVLLPYMVAPVSAGLVWRLLLSFDYGLVNFALAGLGLSRVNWLADATAAVWAVVIPEVWRSTPFVILLLLAGLAAMPTDIFEAAETDGANRWQTLRHLTLPLLAPAITIALVFQSIFKLRVFDLVFILTGGGPGTATLPLGILIQRTYFRYHEGGDAAAQGVVLLLVGAALSAIYLRLVYREVEY